MGSRGLTCELTGILYQVLAGELTEDRFMAHLVVGEIDQARGMDYPRWIVASLVI